MIQQLVAALYIFAVVSHTPVLAEQAFNYAKKFTGQATFYDANSGQGGACSLNNPLPKGTTTMVAAMNAPQYGGSSVCGACVHVSGSKGAVMVRIVNLCPECPSGNLDLSKEAFAVIDDPSKGRVPIEWHVVKCPTMGNLAVKFKDGSSKYWWAIQIRNNIKPVEIVELQQGSGWTKLQRTDYNYFLGSGDAPLTIRVKQFDEDATVLSGINF